MRDELDQRIHAALQAEMDELPLMVTAPLVEQRLAQRESSAWFSMLAGAAAGIVVLAVLAYALGLIPGIRDVGPPTELPRAPDVICGGTHRGDGLLSCPAAVTAAMAALPAGSEPVVRATFLRGHVFTCSDGCAQDIRRDGTVVLDVEGGDDVWVSVRADSAGVAAIGGPVPVPGGQYPGIGAASPGAGEAGTVATWDYVALGVGFTGSASWPQLYARYVEADMGVAVALRRDATGASPAAPSSAAGALERIRTDAALRDRLAQAELISVGPGIEELRAPMLAYADGDPSCGGEDNQDCIRAAMASVKADWEALLDELVALRSPAEANMIAITQAAWLADWACGGWGTPCWEGIIEYWLDLYAFVEESARARGLKVADTLTALHAPGVLEQPVNPAFVRANGMDLTDEGSAVVADVIRAVGY